MSDPSAFVEIATFPRLDQAELAEQFLQAEGVEASVPDRGIVGANPFLVGAVGYLRLLVPSGSAEHALELLRSAGLLSEAGGEAATDLDDEAADAAPADESIRRFLARKG